MCLLDDLQYRSGFKLLIGSWSWSGGGGGGKSIDNETEDGVDLRNIDT